MRKSIILFCILFTLRLLSGNYVIPTQEDVKNNADKVANWQINNFSYSSGNSHDYGIASWTHSVLYMGLAEWAKTETNESYYTWLISIGNTANWTPARNFEYTTYSLYHADEFCVSQFFIAMYKKYGEQKMIIPSVDRLDWVLSNPPNASMSSSNKQSWTWCDALFMAPSVYAQIAVEKEETKYLEFMDKEFRKTYNHLFDKTEKLFFRDDSYFNKTEANGKKVFWGRGNGWALAGIANMLKSLPEDYEHRSYYESIFRELALNLISLQDTKGGWHASLLDPDSYPAAETSATGLITYALVYGLNTGLLTEAEALYPVIKAWNSLCNAIHDNGKLGWVQPIGQDPKTITRDMTATFGVGAFLLTASEMYRLLENEINMPVQIEFVEQTYKLKEGDCFKPDMYFFSPVTEANIEFHSSDPEVVEVSADGELCALSTGDVIITAVYRPDPTITASCEINVSQPIQHREVFFDFGSGTSPVSSGALKVSSKTLFETNGSYGWLSTCGLGERYLNKPANNIELRGFIACSIASTFKVLLEKGRYDITITQGDADYPHEYMIVKANGITKLENITSTKGNYEVNTFEFTVEENYLELEFSKVKHGDPNWVVNSVRIKEKTGSGVGGLSIGYFNNPATIVTVYDLAGKQIFCEQLSNRKINQILNEKDIPSGVYLIGYHLNNESKVLKYIK